MRDGFTKFMLLSTTALGVFVAATAAQAGGFAIREQSAASLGNAFAGVAAGGTPGTLFWNPAIMTQFSGLAFEGTFTVINPHTNENVGAGSTLGFLGGTTVTNPSLVPSTSSIYQLNNNIWLGVSTSAPFGLDLQFPDLWAGRSYAQSTSLRTYNATPSLAFRLNNELSFGVGFQAQYATADFNSGFAVAPGSHINLNAEGFGFGATAGATWTPSPVTTVGLGWRSGIKQDLSGTLLSSPIVGGSTLGPVSLSADLPDTVSLGVIHKLNAFWTVKGTIEWTHWDTIGTVHIDQRNGGPATIGGLPVTIPFEYKDGWFYALGADYQWSPKTTLRIGAAFEQSPITDAVRTPRLPDNDRFWITAGVSHEIWKGLKFDLSYAHIFVDRAPIDISATSGNPSFNGVVTYVGNAETQINLFSVGLRYQWDPTPANPVLYRKG
jgi:long-chain fatty acid transport protein